MSPAVATSLALGLVVLIMALGFHIDLSDRRASTSRGQAQATRTRRLVALLAGLTLLVLAGFFWAVGL